MERPQGGPRASVLLSLCFLPFPPGRVSLRSFTQYSCTRGRDQTPRLFRLPEEGGQEAPLVS